MAEGKKAKKVSITLQEWTETFTAPVVAEIVNVLRSEEKLQGPHFDNELLSSFLSGYVGAMVFSSLAGADNRKLTLDERYELVSKMLTETKARMADAIATGFGVAMTEFSGRSVDYYCNIQPIPEPISKLSN